MKLMDETKPPGPQNPWIAPAKRKKLWWEGLYPPNELRNHRLYFTLRSVFDEMRRIDFDSTCNGLLRLDCSSRSNGNKISSVRRENLGSGKSDNRNRKDCGCLKFESGDSLFQSDRT